MGVCKRTVVRFLLSLLRDRRVVRERSLPEGGSPAFPAHCAGGAHPGWPAISAVH